jgi:Protein of unknown function (DUF2894)
MIHGGTSARAILDAWREQNADRLNPMRFHFIEALERRAASHDGEARRVLGDKLSKLLEAYAGDLEKAASKSEGGDSTTTPCAPARGALGELVDLIASQAAARGGSLAADDVALQPSCLPELEALDDFKKIWSKVRTESQVRQSLEQVPENAGPLNSGSLVHRSITLMRELSPGYLQQFLSYVDALSWIEQMNGGSALVTNDAPRAPSARKRVRSKPRERRE